MLGRPYKQLNPADHKELMRQVIAARNEYFKLIGRAS